MEKNFVIVAYDFPPINSGGNLRPARMLKYFSDKGFNPIVVTIDHEKHLPDRTDKTLCEKLPPNAEIIRTPIEGTNLLTRLIDTGYLFLSDSILFRWKKFLRKNLDDAVAKYKPRFILVTLPPFSIMKLVHNYGREKGIPVILDFRDPLTYWVSSPFPSKLHYKHLKRMERNCIESSFKTLVVTPGMKEIYRKIYPELKDKFEVVMNSFDDYQKTSKTRKSNSKFTIGYFGSFYYNPYSEELKRKKWWQKKPYQYFQYTPFDQDWKYRSPYYFFQAMNELFIQFPRYRDKTEVFFAGNKPEWFDYMVDEFALRDVVKHIGFVGKEEAIRLHETCDAFLITSARFKEFNDYCIAGKTYEYLSQKKPIIAFVCNGDQKWFIENSGIGLICEPDDSIESAVKLEQFFRNKISFKINEEFCNEFLTEKQFNKLYRLIKPLIS